MLRPTLFLALCLLLLAGACDSPPPAGPEPDPDPNSAAFITRLGDDTLAVERFTYTDGGMEATVVLRTPETTVHHYTLATTPDGTLQRYEATVLDPATDAPQREDVVTVEGDSLLLETVYNGDTQTRRIAADGTVVPFLDMIHWPFEWTLREVYAGDTDSVAVPLFGGQGSMPFVIRRLSADSMTITHPFRGTMGVTVDDEGRLVYLDAANTTRRLTVERVPDVDIDAMAEMFAARDAAGQSFGPLSARGETTATIDGATITVDYGVPMKRGRDIFGGLLAWGERWRTGANRATHFSTDRTLQIGTLTVPPGEYTLYTIPEPDGGTLIINKQTGQGGTTYNEDQDLGRVPMALHELPEVVEAFTIRVDDTDAGGMLKLQWDQTEFAIPFTVQ